MKILHVIPNLIKGGAQRLVIDICNELSKKENLECKILVLSTPHNEFHYCSSALDITYCSVSFKLSIYKKNQIHIDSYENFIAEFKPDIIHSHLYFSELVCHENPKSNIKYISHLHSNRNIFKEKKIFDFFFKKNIYEFFEKKRLLKKYIRSNKKFISISSDTYKFFTKEMPQNTFDLVSLPNAINLSRFKSLSNPIVLNKIRLITVGALVPNKNQMFLIDVVRYIKKNNYNVHLNIIGDGPERKKIQNRILELKLTENIKLSGNLDLIEDELKQADFYVHSALNEAFGLVILEAMASRLAVVTLNGRGNNDIIDNGINGFILNEKNFKIYGDIIIKLFSNTSDYKKIVKKGYESALKYDITIYVNKLLKIYKS
jgi:glycosyltransferase involved in cell wall biosynthesis